MNFMLNEETMDGISKEETMEFIKNSKPNKNGNLCLYKGQENAGWVSLYFKYNEQEFEVLITLAANTLYGLVAFFENIISADEEFAIYLDNELISVPLLYVKPINNEKIRFLVADGKRIHDLYKEGKISGEEYDSKGLSGYDIRCDVIVEKKKLLKEFYRAIKNIINTCEIYEEHLYDIDYVFWKDKLRNIVSYLRNNAML